MCFLRGEKSMSSGLRIKAAGGMSNISTAPRVGGTGGIGGIGLEGNIGGFLGP